MFAKREKREKVAILKTFTKKAIGGFCPRSNGFAKNLLLAEKSAFFGKTSKLKFLDDEKNVLRAIGVLRGAVQPRLQRRRGRGRGCQVEVRVEALHQHFPSGFSAEARPKLALPGRPEPAAAPARQQEQLTLYATKFSNAPAKNFESNLRWLSMYF